MEPTLELTLEHRIRERAYAIWHAHGQADGHAHEHWLAAEREILASLSVPPPEPQASTPRKLVRRMRADDRAAPRAARPKKRKA